MYRRAGFTLLELMLVIVMIGIIASAVVLNFSAQSAQEQLDKEATRFQQVFQFIAETAQLQQQEWGLVVREDRYAFVFYDQTQNLWQWAPQPVAAVEHQLPDGMQLQLELEGLPRAEQNLLSQLEWEQEEQSSDPEQEKVRPPLPNVFMLSSGEISPFRLMFQAKEDLQQLQVQIGTDFSIPLTRYSEESY